MKLRATHLALNWSVFCASMVFLASTGWAEEANQVTASSYLERGMSFSRKGDLDRAIVDFGIALQFDPNSALAFSNRADAY